MNNANYELTYERTACLSPLSSSRCLNGSSGSFKLPMARDKRYVKSAWATKGSLDTSDFFFRSSILALNCFAKSSETTSARLTTSSGTPASLATCVPKDEDATPSTNLYRKTSYGSVNRLALHCVEFTCLVFFVVEHSGHVHVPDVWMIGKIIGERTIMCCKEC